jgi:hypothetical protein
MPTEVSKNGLLLPLLLMKRLAWGCAALVLLAVVGRDFVIATTFLGDDYLFRAFARLEPNPLVAFVSDKHGGEYYRPIPMLLWWALERLGRGSVWPFAASAFLLHGTCAVLLGVLAHRLGASRRAAGLAAALFFAAPAQREAALWFSASTDLLAAAAMLGSMVGLLSPRPSRRAVSLLLAGVAFFSKETALVLPFMVGCRGWYRHGAEVRQPGSRTQTVLRKMATDVVPFFAVAAVYLAARLAVLHGLGGNNDPRAPVWAVGIQLLGGVVHAVSAYSPLPEGLAWAVGGAGLAVAGVVLRRSRLAALAALWSVLAVLPLPAAGWVVGARYFYLPAMGLMLLLALALERARPWLPAVVMVVLLGLGVVATNRRASEIQLYRQAVAAAGAAVAAGVAKGARLFLVRGAVKDLDLAIKLDASLPSAVQDAVVIPDVPASFIWLPRFDIDRLRFLFAEPPLPPSGAYRFAGQRLVGLARREEAPDLDEVLTRLPDLRIIRLKLDARPVSWEDATAEYLPR